MDGARGREMNHPPHAIEVKPPKPEQRFVVISRGLIDREDYIYIRPCIARRPVLRLKMKHPLGTIMYAINKIVNHSVPIEDKEMDTIWRAYIDSHPFGIAYFNEVFGLPCDTIYADVKKDSVFISEQYGKVAILPNISDENIALIKDRGYCFITPCEFMHQSTQDYFGHDVPWYVVDEVQRRVFGAYPVTPYNLQGFTADPYRYQYVDSAKPEDPGKFTDTHPRIYGLCTHDVERITTYLGSTDCDRTVLRKPNKVGRWYSFNVNPPISMCVSIKEAKRPVLPTKTLKNGLVGVRATVPAPAWVRFGGYLTLTCRHPLLFRVVFPNECAFNQEYVDVVMVYADHTFLGLGFYVVAVHNGFDMAWIDNRDDFYRKLALQSDFEEVRTRYSLEKEHIALNVYPDDANCIPIEEAHVTIPTLTKSGEYKVQHHVRRIGNVEPWYVPPPCEPEKYYPGDPWSDFEKNGGIIAGVRGPLPNLQNPVLRIGPDMKPEPVSIPSTSSSNSHSSTASSSSSHMTRGGVRAPSNFRLTNPNTVTHRDPGPVFFRPMGEPAAPPRPRAPSNFVLTGPPAPMVTNYRPRGNRGGGNQSGRGRPRNMGPGGDAGNNPFSASHVGGSLLTGLGQLSDAEPNNHSDGGLLIGGGRPRHSSNDGNLLIGGGRQPAMTPIPEETASMMSLSFRAESVLSFRTDDD